MAHWSACSGLIMKFLLIRVRCGLPLVSCDGGGDDGVAVADAATIDAPRVSTAIPNFFMSASFKCGGCLSAQIQDCLAHVVSPSRASVSGASGCRARGCDRLRLRASRRRLYDPIRVVYAAPHSGDDLGRDWTGRR